jgi:hypothetical protein
VRGVAQARARRRVAAQPVGCERVGAVAVGRCQQQAVGVGGERVVEFAFASLAGYDDRDRQRAFERGLQFGVADELVGEPRERLAAAVPFQAQLEQVVVAGERAVAVGTDELAPGPGCSGVVPTSGAASARA